MGGLFDKFKKKKDTEKEQKQELNTMSEEREQAQTNISANQDVQDKNESGIGQKESTRTVSDDNQAGNAQTAASSNQTKAGEDVNQSEQVKAGEGAGQPQSDAEGGSENGAKQVRYDSFVYGVEDTFKLQDSDDLVVVGKVRGTVDSDMGVWIRNVGEDNNREEITTVLGLEIKDQKVTSATNCLVALRIEHGQELGVKIGTVIYSRGVNEKLVHEAYVEAIGDAYVLRKNMTFTEEDLAGMSITDCAEAWRLFVWKQSQNKEEKTDEEKKDMHDRINVLGRALAQKILEADEVYAMINKATGEPHMFSRTYAQQNGAYTCAPPYIVLVSKAYADSGVTKYSNETIDLVKIENGEKRDGIRNFLGSAFYLNGAFGVSVISDQIVIEAGVLVPKPDYKNVPKQNIPVTNPDLVRWMLLIGQLGQPDNPDKELIYKLYYRFLAIELTKATLLIPMQKEGEIPPPDANGKVVLQKGVQLKLPTVKGKQDRDAVRMFTDWRRFYMEFDKEWAGLAQPIDGMIDRFDCLINATKFPAAGCYISKAMYDEVKQNIKRDVERAQEAAQAQKSDRAPEASKAKDTEN